MNDSDLLTDLEVALSPNIRDEKGAAARVSVMRRGHFQPMGERTPRRLLIIGASAVASWTARKGRAGGIVARSHAASQVSDAGQSGSGEQDGAGRLGAARQRRNLSNSDHGCMARSRGCRRRRKVKRKVWRNGRGDGIGKTRSWMNATSARDCFGSDPRTPNRAGGMQRAASKAGYMSAPDYAPRQSNRFFLLQRGRPYMSE